MKKTFAVLLCCAMLLTGCAGQDTPYVPTGDGLTWDEDYTGPTVETTRPEQEQELLLTYYPEAGMNPYNCNDFTNRALFSLLYQGLFTADRDYQVEPILCKRFHVTEDLRTYTFYVENATFSNGQRLTANDVVASLLAAKESTYYGGRFLNVTEVALSPDGGVSVQLSTSYENLPLLLDVPIVPAAQVQEDRPAGTGPYRMELTASGAALYRRTNWWCDAPLLITADVIPVMKAESATQIRDSFEFHDLSLVCADPGTDRYSDYRCDYELWDCENGIFMYLTTSKDSEVFSNEEVRKALTYAIDRDMIVENYFRGFARSASLPASPLSPYYSDALAARYEYAALRFPSAVQNAGMEGKEIKFLVNSNDSLRVRVARKIAEELEKAGLKVTMLEQNGQDYLYTLQSWTFDLYLGQTKLSPNMDLSAFYTTYGELSCGGINDVAIYALCQQALENHGNYYTLYQTIMDSGRLCPILFRSYAIYATRGLVTGLTPSRDNIFYYSLGKTMEQAQISQ